MEQSSQSCPSLPSITIFGWEKDWPTWVTFHLICFIDIFCPLALFVMVTLSVLLILSLTQVMIIQKRKKNTTQALNRYWAGIFDGDTMYRLRKAQDCGYSSETYAPAWQTLGPKLNSRSRYMLIFLFTNKAKNSLTRKILNHLYCGCKRS